MFDPASLPAFEAKQYKALIESRDHLVRQAGGLEAERRALAADPEAAEMHSDVESGEVAASVERETDLLLSADLADELRKTNRAIANIEAGTYGVCAECNTAIPRARLQYLPEAEFCVTCLERLERLYRP